MKNIIKACVPCLLVLSATACSNPADKILIKKNPSPVQAYVMTLDASHAPGEVKETYAYMTFENAYSGSQCMPEPPGMVEWRMPRERIELDLKPVEGKPNVFEGTVYLDWLQDENYFGKGLCAWRMNMAGAGFVGAGGLGFATGIGHTHFEPGAEDTAYFKVESFTALEKDSMYPFAYSVPTNDFKLDPKNSYVNDTTKYFPVYIRVRPAEGSPGLSAKDEFEVRTGYKSDTL